MGDSYNEGLWGNFSFFMGSNWNFVPGYIKNVDTQHGSFGLKKQVIKKVVAKKPLINLYEMNSRDWPSKYVPYELIKSKSDVNNFIYIPIDKD